MLFTRGSRRTSQGWVHVMQNSTAQMRNQIIRSEVSCRVCGLSRIMTGSLTIQYIHDSMYININMVITVSCALYFKFHIDAFKQPCKGGNILPIHRQGKKKKKGLRPEAQRLGYFSRQQSRIEPFLLVSKPSSICFQS